jgi:hypothetical protein
LGLAQNFFKQMRKGQTQAEFWAGLKIGAKNRLNLVKKFCLGEQFFVGINFNTYFVPTCELSEYINCTIMNQNPQFFVEFYKSWSNINF